jgi:NAD(P)-dependent dehydrogenase (short-subunit alcohol dehydrogenase family)
MQGGDALLEAALRERGLEVVARGPAEALLTTGPPPVVSPLAEVTADEWRLRFRVWMEQPFWAFQSWLQELLDRGGSGRWIALTSTLGARPFPGGGVDGSFAVGLQTLVRIAAIEYGSRGIRANAIACGWRAATLPAPLDQQLALADTPTGRLTSESDVAAAIAWLLSGDADQVNGEIIRLDGGYTVGGGSRPDPTASTP